MDRNRCGSCQFWAQTTNWESNIINSGECSRIRDGIDIDITYGWEGGYINRIETEENFGCVFHIMK